MARRDRYVFLSDLIDEKPHACSTSTNRNFAAAQLSKRHHTFVRRSRFTSLNFHWQIHSITSFFLL